MEEVIVELWLQDLIDAVRTSHCKFESIELVANEAHARTVIAILHALQDDPSGTVFAEPRTPDRGMTENARPTDILILHPFLGAFLIEVKGWVIGEISHIEAGTIFRRVKGYEEAKNPWNQAQNAAMQLQKATRRVIERRKLVDKQIPHFDWITALPNISKTAWIDKGFDHSLNGSEVLLAEHLADPASLRSRLFAYVAAKARRRLPFLREQLDNVREALGSSYVISKRDRKANVHALSLGKAIDVYEIKDKRLSAEQIEIIESEFDGRPQLIRGVAGSGKSIVLVRNCVNLIDRIVNSHQLNLPIGESRRRRVAIICFNRALVPFLRRNLEDAYRELTNQDLPDCIDIVHVQKLGYQMSTLQGGPLTYQGIKQYRRQHESEPIPSRIAAHYVRQLDQLAKSHPAEFYKLQYDSIYVDEGQDLFDEEYLLLMKLLRSDPETGSKNIVIFYDDAQNIYGRPRPTWSKLGIQISGRRTFVMRTCFRNSKQIIEFAFNVLLGVTAETRVMTRTFADITYLKDNRLVEELSDRWQINFAERAEGMLPEVRLFATRDDEKNWINGRITQLISDEGVRPEDLLILFKESSEFLDLPPQITALNPSIVKVIQPFGSEDNPAKDEYILEEGSLTVTTVESAKGYDAPIVFVIGCDLFATTTEGRACFYVGASRAKLHLFVTGLEVSGSLADEAKQVADLLSSPPLASSLKDTNEKPQAQDQVLDLVAYLYRTGDVVRHHIYGRGIVLADGKPKILISQKCRCQDVKVQFDAGIKDIVAEIAGLALVESS